MPKAPAREKVLKKKPCAFCKDKSAARSTTRTPRCCASSSATAARSAPGESPGNCVQHQRDIAVAVKNSREVALLPYVATAR